MRRFERGTKAVASRRRGARGTFGHSPTGLLLGVFLSLSACTRSPEEPVSQKPAPAQANSSLKREEPSAALQAQAGTTAKAEPLVNEVNVTYRLPAAERVVAIGDLHGDFAATERAFRLAGAIDNQGNWAGGKLVVVQTGDQLDRGDDERKIIDFLERLSKQAKAEGGDVVVLNGNHETMNVNGDFRYVTPGALGVFDDLRADLPAAAAFPEPLRGRAGAFLPGGGAAKLLSERRIVVMVGETVFVHGGLLPAHVRYGIERLNRESRAWMRGESSAPPAPLTDENGPVWTRAYADRELAAPVCAALSLTLKELGAKRLVIGHSVQEKGMAEGCDGKVYRIDVGLSRYYGDNPAQVLELVGGEAKILTEKN